MKKNYLIIAILMAGVLAFYFAEPAQATIVMDQSQQNVKATGGFSYYEQSFQQSYNNITGAGVFMAGYETSPIGNINLWIEDFGGNTVASGQTSTSGFGWYDIDFGGIFDLTFNTEYYLFASTSSKIYLAWDDNVYSRGSMLLPEISNEHDLAFRTFADDEHAPVPEPATMLLFGTGLAGLVGNRIRRKKTKKP